VYLGINCAACHTRQLTYSRADRAAALGPGSSRAWRPSLADMPRFKQELYDAFLAVVTDDNLAREFAKGVLVRSRMLRTSRLWRDEVREFTGPSCSRKKFSRTRGFHQPISVRET